MTPRRTTMNIYLVADVRAVVDRATAMPDGITVRPVAPTDIPDIAELFLSAYASMAKTLDNALAEVTGAFAGTWGVHWPDASPGAWAGGELASVVQSVRRPGWDDAPDLPWIIDVFTDPGRRRTGLARGLLGVACRAMEIAGEPRVGLTVDDQNVAAVALYESLGFAKA
jgi:ribosomal protein S18 acetylase RimI-like enzyme